MNENEMGYRGSKSAKGLNKPASQIKPGAVKEQRVDGSYATDSDSVALRCTLMGFKRSYQIKVLSNQKRFYTENNSNMLNPWFITGFADAESTFNIFVQPRVDSKTNWRVKAIFAIGLHKKDIAILENIQSWLGVGRIYSTESKI